MSTDRTCSLRHIGPLPILPLLIPPLLLASASRAAGTLERLQYNHPGLLVDLGVGLWAWPMPMDWDGDGDLDLVVSCPDVPFNGTYLFENPGGKTMPVFKPPVRLGPALRNVRLSYVDGQPRVLTPGTEWTDFLNRGFSKTRKIAIGPIRPGPGKIRANQWHYVDYDGDGAQDVLIGIGYWGDYGWDNAFDSQGRWQRGPLHGYVYLARNRATTDRPDYAPPEPLLADGRPVDVYGMPSPNLADFDGDGDLDLLCGEFLDGFTYFRNVGTRTAPRYAAGRRLIADDGRPLTMDLQMITPTAVDWDADGDTDLVCGDEDGRVALIENTGRLHQDVPIFRQPAYFRQQAQYVKFGALVTPVSVDWDADGDEDLVCGNTAGYIGFIENLDGGDPPRWAAPVRLQADGKTIRIQAGPNGSIQGPCEAKWGYTTLSAADWDADGRIDLVVNSIWGRVVWYRNIGTRTAPRLAAAQPIKIQWPAAPPKPAWNWWNPAPGELVTQWRTTPAVVDWNRDGFQDLVMLDHEGYLAFFERQHRDGRLILLPPKRIFTDANGPLRLNPRTAGRSGRRKLCIVDWDRDGRLDVLVNSTSVDFLRNAGTQNARVLLTNEGPLTDRKLAGHTTSPTTVDWDRDGHRELLIGAEDGHLYRLVETSPNR